MPTTFTIVPIPRWYFADLSGDPLGGGRMATYRSLVKTTPKAIYTDASGTFAWPNPVFFNANGEAPGPFFWADDEAYYIEIYDADNNLMFTMDNYGPGISGGGGGGGGSTSYLLLKNYVTNNLFLDQAGTPSGTGNTFVNIQSGTVIAPSNHHGLVYGATGIASIPYVGPDIMFVRSNNSSTDTLTFATSDFNFGNVPLTGDVTPEYYIDLTCTATGTETLKAVQWPIDLHVKNLEQQVVTFIVWAKGVSGVENLTAKIVQFFGTGAAEVPVSTPLAISASPLTHNWEAYTFVLTSAIPSVGGKVPGGGGDDATYLQIAFPTGAAFRILFTKPKLYLGTVALFPELQTYDDVDRVINSPRTGDVRTSYNSHQPYGWVICNDGTIGNAASLATTRANIDTWPLYSLLWNSVGIAWAPMADAAPYGASAIIDFNNGRAISLTKMLGRALSNIGTPFADGTDAKVLGQYDGEQKHTMTLGELVAHTHPPITGSVFTTFGGGGTNNFPGGGQVHIVDATTGTTGSTTPFNVIQPTTYMNVFLKL